MSPIIAPVVRRAILDLLEDIGGEHNHRDLQLMLNELGHRVAQRDVAEQVRWLADAGLVTGETIGVFEVVRALPDGCDVANGLLTIDGVSRHKTGE